MKAYKIGPQTGLDSLHLSTKPDLVAGPGEAIVKVRMVCLNHRDMLVLNGTYGARRPEDRTPVSEGMGEILSLGEGVTGLAPGTRVVAPHFVTWLDGAFHRGAFQHDVGITHDGWLAEQVRVPAAALIAVPDALTDMQVAPLSSSALTAWNAVVEVGKVKAGDTVLALGTGGVSIFALQIAKMHGARVAITSSSDEKLELARSLGADICINYRTRPDWEAALLEATGGGGADIVVDTAGQATLRQSIDAAAVNGRIALIGALAGQAKEGLPNFGAIIGKNLVIAGIAEGSRAMLARLVRAIEVNGLQPVIDRVFGFDEALEAYRYLHAGTHVGKVLIKF
ncbi:zinc-dependent alcohol dehydrogenase family protein [Sphingomonas hengshuiensis]|uniref:Alcohol dehydrogenase n=1 Tax=Sphingomonas hengshuiensis TaxID=1609977 RepID=A0A7U4J9Q1_9SPHN|nr:NAD(P)-dependent alcohol dehydrogenase [Sphingomonas hengshuiensis]AJP72811.1 alcohol dehydrogenase [Sphingomonas hengshuiensis]